MLAHGHRTVAFMGDDVVTGLLRLEGCRQALTDAGLPHHDGLVHFGGVDTETITAALRRIFADAAADGSVLVERALHGVGRDGTTGVGAKRRCRHRLR